MHLREKIKNQYAVAYEPQRSKVAVCKSLSIVEVGDCNIVPVVYSRNTWQ